MNTLQFILLCLSVSFIIAYSFYIAKKNSYVKQIIDKFPHQVEALCRFDLSDGTVSPSMKKEILSYNYDSWEDWLKKVTKLKSLSSPFSHVISEYILYYFPYVKDYPQYRNNEVFGRKDVLCNTLIQCLLYDDILKLDIISSDEWVQKDKILKKAESLCLSNPDAIREFRKKEPDLSIDDIIRLQKQIEQLQHRYTIATAFDAWLTTQKEFNTTVRNLRDEYAKNCGCYHYDIKFHKPLSSGKFSTENFRIWQIFLNAISPYFEELHSTLSFSMQQDVPELKARKMFYYNRVYDKVLPYINAVSKDKSILVTFINRTSYNWDSETYEFHYKYIKSLLDSNNIAYVDFENLSSIIDSFEYDIVFVFDFITVNSDLIYTSKLIIESFSTKIPNIVWYSMIKEYDEAEMKELCADAIKEEENKKKETEQKYKEEQELRDIVQSKSKSLQFIRNQLLRMKKASRFSLFAVTNTLIGDAVNSSDVKKIWMPDPNEIQMTSSLIDVTKKPGFITVKYSIDRGMSWQNFEIVGKYDNIDNVTLFTYEFFNTVGVLTDFIEKGALAIDYMNTHNYLSS